MRPTWKPCPAGSGIPSSIGGVAASAALSAYAAMHGHAHPTQGQRFNGYPVGEWVRAQRAAQKNHRLSAARAALLEALPGWCWISSGVGDSH